MDTVVSDEMLEAWFAAHANALSDTPEHALADVALWFPMIGIAANDRSIGVLHECDCVSWSVACLEG